MNIVPADVRREKERKAMVEARMKYLYNLYECVDF